MSILQEIIRSKKLEIRDLSRKKPLEELRDDLTFLDEPLSFTDALTGNRVSLICEYKRASPSSGRTYGRGLHEMMEVYREGADAVSVITENRYFHGSIEFLREASEYGIPLLMKDFVVDEYQIYQARASGASSVLLITGVFPDLESGIETCRELSMEPLVECHSAIDIYRAIEAGAEIIGVNNRNLETLEVNLGRTRALAPLVPDELLLVSESGVRGPEDAEILAGCGADALLIGTSLMLASDPRELLDEIIAAVKSCRPGRKRYSGDEFFEQFA
ncbi:indole-3-glycerol-phosphate synthase [Methanothermobacter sp.]|uniref:indole-3-glycerol phosphate synthase TrpC n=1 Tax=Methanothermobacter sp. TaxID=1884223 RepID=UPI00261CC150|nr:indole-3-glycerol phosphate synthase TrpC [Methanothermobacter sp.]MDI9618048.1 indole-3-glycerol phosphate synthase TrpC [Methanothermobacter sp.]